MDSHPADQPDSHFGREEDYFLNELRRNHPLRGLDLRTLNDDQLAGAAARALLSHRGISETSNISKEIESEVSSLGSSVFRRSTRLIVQLARVSKLSSLNRPTEEQLEDLVEMTTLAFVHTVGAFDSLAILNGRLAGMEQYRDMGWQKRQYRKRLRSFAPEAVSLMDEGSHGFRYYRAVLSYRNLVHRQMPDIGTRVDRNASSTLRPMILLESGRHDEVMASFASDEWTKIAGIDQIGPRFLFLNPELTVRRLVTGGMPLLNRLLSATPFPSSHGAALDPDDSLLPTKMQRFAVERFGLTDVCPPIPDAAKGIGTHPTY